VPADIPDDAVPVPARITIALDACNLYGPDVDAACGGAEPDVDEWELGVSVPSRRQVELLAALCRMPVAYFYEPWDEVEAAAARVFICHRGGPRGKRCRAGDGTVTPPAAQRDPRRGQGALW
jgi:hypothetical protein